MQTILKSGLVLALIIGAQGWADEPRPLHVFEGSTKKYTMEGLIRAEVGDSAICGARAELDELTLVGKKPGLTSLAVQTSKGGEKHYREYIITVEAAPSSVAEPGETHLRLSLGQMKVLTMKDVARVAIADPEVADLNITSSELVIVPNSVGVTTLVVWLAGGKRESYRIEVSARLGGEAVTSPDGPRQLHPLKVTPIPPKR